MSECLRFCLPHLNCNKAQKNKATSYHLGLLKAKLAKLRRELISPTGGGGGGGGLGFDVARTGIASVGFVGFPSVGKVSVVGQYMSIGSEGPLFFQSTLMSKLTGTHSEVSEIDFTTLTTVPGTLKVHGAPIQILDLRQFKFCEISSNRIHSHLLHQLVSLKEQQTARVVVDKVNDTYSDVRKTTDTSYLVIAGIVFTT